MDIFRFSERNVSTTALPKNLTPYKLLIDPENFRLAWERVRYFDRPDSRDWIGLKVFAANRDHNLEMLRQSVIERTFEPTFPEIRYVPKPSLTLRPMAVLTIGDRVVFQAIANVVAEKARAALSMVANRQSFANVLTEPGQTPMFVHWKIQYRRFQDQFCDLISEDNGWLAETDAAAFYETIDHQLLLKCLLESRFLDDEAGEYLNSFLPVWSSVRTGSLAPRGIPQGCLASDLLANTFLYGFDRDLASQEYHYLRYVDDIRILGKTKEAVQRGLIRIDTQLKSLGILLQTKKTTVRRVSNVTEEVDRLAVQLSELDQRLREPDPLYLASADPILEPSLHDVALLGEDFNDRNDAPDPTPTIQQELIDLFWKSKKSIDSNHEDPFAERHFRFCLYRLEPDTRIIDAVLPYLVEKPWLGEIVTLYLRRCKLGTDTIHQLQSIVATHNVYDNIVAHAIDTLIRQNASLRGHHDLMKQWVIDEKRQWPLLCNTVIALGEAPDNMSVILQATKSSSPSVRRMAVIQALRLARTEHEAIHICKTAIMDSSPIVTEALLYLLYNEWSLTLGDLDLDDQHLPDHCIASAKGYDISLPAVTPDYVRHVFVKSYSVEIRVPVDFHALLGQDYDRAARFLWQAENSFLANASRYVSQLDLFHEELLYPILVDKLSLKETRHELAQVEWTNRIELLLKQQRELASFAGALLECRRLRANPETHTRLHKELTRTSFVSWRQRSALKKKLCAGYQELTDWIAAGCPR